MPAASITNDDELPIRVMVSAQGTHKQYRAGPMEVVTGMQSRNLEPSHCHVLGASVRHADGVSATIEMTGSRCQLLNTLPRRNDSHKRGRLESSAAGFCRP